MTQLDPHDPTHLRARKVLRLLGPITLLAGIALVGIAVADFVRADFGRPPTRFWLAFIGMPLMFIGAVMSILGFMQVLARYQMREGVPPTTEAFNYAAQETQEGVRTVAGAIGSGLREGLGAGRVDCPRCGAGNEADARFCKSCGASIAATA